MTRRYHTATALRLLLRDNAEDFLFAHDEVLLAVHLDFLAGVLAEENRVPFLDVERRDLSILFDLALAHSDDLALLRLLLGGIGDDDPADFLFAFLEALHDDAVVQRTNLDCGCGCCHTVFSPVCRAVRPPRPTVGG